MREFVSAEECDQELLDGILALVKREGRKPVGLKVEVWKVFKQWKHSLTSKSLFEFIQVFEWSFGAKSRNEIEVSTIERIKEKNFGDDPQATYEKLFFIVFQRLCKKGVKRLTVDELGMAVEEQPNEQLLQRLTSRLASFNLRLLNLESAKRIHEERLNKLESSVSSLVIYDDSFSDSVDRHEIRFEFGAMELPQGIVERPEYTELVIDAFKSIEDRNSIALTTAFLGAGGFGKTYLALLVAHHPEIKKSFPHGVLWLEIGKNPVSVTGLVKDLIFQITSKHCTFSSPSSATSYLAALLEHKRYLIVIDDVWNSSHLSPFMVGGKNCTRLVTTRVKEVSSQCSDSVDVGTMERDQSIAVLSNGIDDLSKKDLGELGEQLGNWPVLLNLANAYLRSRVEAGQSPQKASRSLQQTLSENGITAFDYRDAAQRHQAVDATIQFGMDSFTPHEKQKIFELGIFPSSRIPISAVKTLWNLESGSDVSSENLLIGLHNFSILTQIDFEAGMVQLHDVFREYFKSKISKNWIVIQNRFLESHGIENWCEMPEEVAHEYIKENLFYHLREAGRDQEAHHLLTGNSEWMQARQKYSGGNGAYLRDLETEINTFGMPITGIRVSRLIELVVARQTVFDAGSQLDDLSLKTLVWLKEEKRACDSALQRKNLAEKVSSIVEVCSASIESGSKLDMSFLALATESTDLIPEASEKAKALAEIATVYFKCGASETAFGLLDSAFRTIRLVGHYAIRGFAVIDVAVIIFDIGLTSLAVKMIKSVDEISDPNRVAACIIRLVAAGESQYAQELMLFLENQGFGLEILAKVAYARGLIQVGDESEAYRQLSEAINGINEIERNFSTQNLDPNEIHFDDSEEATYLAESKRETFLGLIALGDTEKAFEVIEEIELHGFSDAMNSLTRLSRQLPLKERTEIFERMAIAGVELEHVTAQRMCLSSLALIQAQEGNCDAARATLEFSNSGQFNTEEWIDIGGSAIAIVNLLSNNGKNDLAVRLLDDTEESIRKVGWLSKGAKNVADLIVAFRDCGLVERSQDLMREFDEYMEAQQQSPIESTHAYFVRALAKTGRSKQALEALRRQNRGYAALLGRFEYYMASEPRERSEAVQEMKSLVNNSLSAQGAVSLLVEILVVEGELEEAIVFAKKSFTKFEYARCLCILAIGFHNAGMSSKANEALDLSLETSGKLELADAHVAKYWTEACLALGRIPHAIKAYDTRSTHRMLAMVVHWVEAIQKESLSGFDGFETLKNCMRIAGWRHQNWRNCYETIMSHEDG